MAADSGWVSGENARQMRSVAERGQLDQSWIELSIQLEILTI